MATNMANTGVIDFASPSVSKFIIKPGDTFELSFQNISSYLDSVGIIFIGDTQQRLGVFTSGYYLFKFPAIGTTHKLTIAAGQILPMAGESENLYSGEIQIIKPTGDLKSFAFDVAVSPLDKLQLVTAIAAQQHNYSFIGIEATAPASGANYRIYYNSTSKLFAVYSASAWNSIT